MMEAVEHIDFGRRPRLTPEVRAHAKRVRDLYSRSLEAYPTSALYNTSDVRVLVAVIDDFLRVTARKR